MKNFNRKIDLLSHKINFLAVLIQLKQKIKSNKDRQVTIQKTYHKILKLPLKNSHPFSRLNQVEAIGERVVTDSPL